MLAKQIENFLKFLKISFEILKILLNCLKF